MTKKDFLNALANGLKDLPPSRVSDILFDYQDYFNSQKDKMSEEEMIMSLGSIDKIIRNYRNEHSNTANNTMDFTAEIPIINTENLSETSFHNEVNSEIHREKENTSFEENITEEFNTDNSSKKTKKRFFKKEKKDFISKKPLTKEKKYSNFQDKQKINTSSEKVYKKKSFLGYLFSLPLLALSLPIGLGLGLASFFAYISLILFITSIGVAIFLVSFAPTLIGFSGFLVILVKSFGNMIFVNIPSFILDFPTFFIFLLSLSFLFLGIGIFNLGISYCKTAKRTIISFSNSLFKILFKRGAGSNETV